MPLLPRYNASAQRIEDERKLSRIILESVGPAPDVHKKLRLMTPQRLRGFPIQTKGVGGAVRVDSEIWRQGHGD